MFSVGDNLGNWTSTKKINKNETHPLNKDPPNLCDSLSVYLSVHQWMCSSIVDVNTTSDRRIIEQLGHEITQKDRGRAREMETGDKRWRKRCGERDEEAL